MSVRSTLGMDAEVMSWGDSDQHMKRAIASSAPNEPVGSVGDAPRLQAAAGDSALETGLNPNAPEIPATGGSFTFRNVQPLDSSIPITFDPCKRIRVTVNDARAPEGSMALVEEAIERARSATGMNIVLTGTTDDNRWEDREMNDPVLISWATAAENAHLAGDVAGVATSIWWELSPGVGRTMTGSIVLDLELFANPDVAKETKQAILLHEMAHVLGLGHVDDPDELMYYSALRTDYGPGDLEGLARIGNAPCD